MSPRCLLLLAALLPFPAKAADLKPTPLTINTAADEDEPHPSSSQLTLYYASNAEKKWEILASQRAQGKPWPVGKPMLGYIATEVDDRSTYSTADGRFPQYLFFATKKDKETNNFDIYVAQRIDAKREFSAPTPLNTVCTAEDELHPWLLSNGRALTFSRKTKDGWRVYMTTRMEATGGGGFGPPICLDELPPDFHHATLTSDARVMYLQGPLGEGRWGLFRSEKTGAKWSKPVALDKLNGNGPRGDVSPCLTRDGAYLYFASDRSGGKGGLDIYSIPIGQLR